MSDKLNLRQKLVKIYEELDHVEKTGKNAKQNYDYVKSADVLREVRKALLKYGIWAETNFEFVSEYQIPTNSGGKMFAARVKAIVTLYDADSDETKVVSGFGDGADGGDKGIYKAQTGAIKNALRNGTLLPDSADPEADESVDEATQEQTTRKRGRPASAPPPFAPVPQPTESRVAASVPLAEPTLGINIPDAIPATDAVLPTEAKLQECRMFIQSLKSELEQVGLKPSRNLPTARKILLYLLDVTGADAANKITVTQWDTLVGFVNKIRLLEGGLDKLVKLVDAAAKKHSSVATATAQGE